ncbi:MAG: folate-binding protein YgfZ [Pseudomonadota bacterium]
MPFVILPNRKLIEVTGSDAEHLLQNVITCNVEDLAPGVARAGALLTPQGKIMFDFLVWRTDDGVFTIDIDAEQADAFIKRMTLYKLRSDVAFSLLNESLVAVGFSDDSGAPLPQAAIRVKDERFAALDVQRFVVDADAAPSSGDPISAWQQLRIAHGVAEGGADYALGDAFPHDVSLDQNQGVDFKKGCYVGQEVVSRMQHRGTARRRVMIVTADQPLTSDAREVTADGKPVGTIGTIDGQEGLMIGRLDRVRDALDDATALLVGSIALTAVRLPDGVSYDWPKDGVENG